MVKSMLSGVSGLRSHQQKMDVIGNNIANVNTWGYKTASYAFKDAVYQTALASTGGANVIGGMGGKNPSQIGGGTGLGSINTSFTPGNGAPTDDPLNCMITGTGFFIVGPLSAGGPTIGGNISNSGLSLSRVGIFRKDNQGYLVDSEGSYLYGARPIVDNNGDPVLDPNGQPTYNTALEPLQIPIKPGTTPPARYDLQNLKISADGTVVGMEEGGKTVIVGKIALASVENANGLEKDAGYYYAPGANAGVVTATFSTGGGTLGGFKSNYLEMANVDLAREFAEMITTQRGFQANSKIITVADEMLQELVNMKR